MVMDMPVQVPVDNPNADTEWNDILRKHGVIPEKPPSPTATIEKAFEEAVQQQHERRLEDKGVNELDELEDEEDETFLEKYRQQRMKELSSLARASVFNQVFPVQKSDYAKDVTEASKKSYVLVHMTSSLGTNAESRLVTEIWRQLAAKFGDIKFCEIRADLCVEDYPEQNTPTVLVYKDEDIKKQLITLKELRGDQTTSQDFEQMLVRLGAIAKNDHRLQKKPKEGVVQSKSIREGTINKSHDDDDDDWD